MRRAWATMAIVASLAVAACASTAPHPATGNRTRTHAADIDDSTGRTLAPVPAAAAHYVWADDTDDLRANLFTNAACFTVLRGLTPAQALRLVAPDRIGPMRTPAGAQQAADRLADLHTGDNGPYFTVVTAVRRGPYTLVLEDGGYAATVPGTLRSLSAQGAATVLFVNVNSVAEFAYALHGRLLRSFDPLIYTEQVGRRLPQERDLPLGTQGCFDHPLALSMELTRRLLGYSARPADLRPDGYTSAVVVRVE